MRMGCTCGKKSKQDNLHRNKRKRSVHHPVRAEKCSRPLQPPYGFMRGAGHLHVAPHMKYATHAGHDAARADVGARCRDADACKCARRSPSANRRGNQRAHMRLGRARARLQRLHETCAPQDLAATSPLAAAVIASTMGGARRQTSSTSRVMPAGACTSTQLSVSQACIACGYM